MPPQRLVGKSTQFTASATYHHQQVEPVAVPSAATNVVTNAANAQVGFLMTSRGLVLGLVRVVSGDLASLRWAWNRAEDEVGHLQRWQA
jgi:hypothetical protein